MGLPLKLYRLAAPLLRPRTAAGEAGLTRPARPPGPLIWLHVQNFEDMAVADSIVSGLTDLLPDIWFMITSSDGMIANLSDNCIAQILPADSTPAIASFLEYWNPDLLVWLGGALPPALIADSASKGFPLYLLDSDRTLKKARKWSKISGLTGTTLKAFTIIFADDEDTAADLRSAGANSSQIEVIGALERETPVLACSEAERHSLTQILNARPVWLAAQIDPLEYEPVISAHMFAMRKSHRYLLILVPSDPSQGDVIASILNRKGLSYARRSFGEEPDAETQIYLADTDGEMGLWYRLAPVAFIGATFPKAKPVGANPIDAASLGSAVIHGHHTTVHEETFRRLEQAGASRSVSNAEELASMVDSLLAPDRAAEMAHAAWQVCSAGADATDTVIKSLVAELGKRGETR